MHMHGARHVCERAEGPSARHTHSVSDLLLHRLGVNRQARTVVAWIRLHFYNAESTWGECAVLLYGPVIGIFEIN
jgi:hypothetical protein